MGMIAFIIAPILLGKDMNPIFLPLAMDKLKAILGYSAFVGQLIEEKEHFKFKPVKLRWSITLWHFLPMLRDW